MTNIELVSAEDVKNKGNSKGVGKYSKYREALGPYIDYFKTEIGKSKDGKVRVKINEILQVVGDGVGKNPTSVFWGTKYVLFQNGMFATQGTHKDGSSLVIIRKSTENDQLPGTLGETEIGFDKNIEISKK